MKKILIPIDFTPASLNAVAYAAALSNDSDATDLVLVANAHLTTFEQVFPSPDFLPAQPETQEEIEKELNEKFDNLRDTYLNHLRPGIRLLFHIARITLLTSLHEIVVGDTPDLIILGGDFGDDSALSFIGDHLLKIAKTSTIPVLIIPRHSAYQTIRQVLIPINSSNATRLELLPITDILRTKPKLILLTVRDDFYEQPKRNKSSDGENNFADIISNYLYDSYEAFEHDPLTSIKTFLEEKNVQLIIALPGIHHFLYHLTHQNITTGLVKNDHIPVLVLNANNASEN